MVQWGPDGWDDRLWHLNKKAAPKMELGNGGQSDNPLVEADPWSGLRGKGKGKPQGKGKGVKPIHGKIGF